MTNNVKDLTGAADTVNMHVLAQYLPWQAKDRINKLLRSQGWVRGVKPRELEDEFQPIWNRCEPLTETTIERGYALFQAVRHVHAHGIPGAFVECGTWRGGSSMVAALTAEQIGWDGDFFLFDTFAGMPKPEEVDGELAMNNWIEGQREDHNEWLCASEEQVRGNVLSTGLPAERLHTVKGPVEETLPHAPLTEISILRLDTDWYSSTLHELRELYPLLSPGGVLIVDDYGFWQGAKIATDEYLASIDGPPMLTRLDHTGRIALKPDWSERGENRRPAAA